MNAYQVGDRVRITGTFTNSAAALADPTTATILVKRRDGATTTYTYAGGTVTRLSLGVFYADHDVTLEGAYDYRIIGTGAIVTAGEGSFSVPDSQFF